MVSKPAERDSLFRLSKRRAENSRPTPQSHTIRLGIGLAETRRSHNAI
jgi:hypothetical protein